MRRVANFRNAEKICFRPKPGSGLTTLIFIEFKSDTNKLDLLSQRKANAR